MNSRNQRNQRLKVKFKSFDFLRGTLPDNTEQQNIEAKSQRFSFLLCQDCAVEFFSVFNVLNFNGYM